MTSLTISRDETYHTLSSVLGNEALRGQLLGSGTILKLIDLCSSGVSSRITRNGGIVTVSFDTFRVIRPLLHGDFVRLEGRALSVGKSSIVCQVSVYREDFTTGKFQLTHNVVTTFVAIDKQGKPVRELPELVDPAKPHEAGQLRQLASQRRVMSTRWRQSQDDVSVIPHITHDMIPSLSTPLPDGYQAINIQDTLVETRHSFLLKHANGHYKVFGGVLLDMMDRAALLCARNFTKNVSMVTIAMNRLHFKQPIGLHNVISIRARICRIKKYSVEVEMVVYRVGLHEEYQLSHTGCFEVLNLETFHYPPRFKEVKYVIVSDESDQDGMQSLLKAHRRQLYEKDDAQLQSKLPPIPVSIPSTYMVPAKL